MRLSLVQHFHQVLDAVNRLDALIGLAAVAVELRRTPGREAAQRCQTGDVVRLAQGAHALLQAVLALDDVQDALNALAENRLIAGRLLTIKLKHS